MKIIKRLPGLPVERAIAVLSGRWKAVILYVLLDGQQRTYELEKHISGISQKVLIEQLTGRRVLAFLSQAHVEPDITLEVFFVDRPLAGSGAVEVLDDDKIDPA